LGLAQCYTVREIPYDIFDAADVTAQVGQSVIDIIPDVEGLIQCSMVTDAFTNMAGGVLRTSITKQ
jgi:hypothetical protein